MVPPAMLVFTIKSRYASSDSMVDVSISITGGDAAGVVGGVGVGAGAWLLGAFPASATVTELEPVNLGVVSFTFGGMMGLERKLLRKP